MPDFRKVRLGEHIIEISKYGEEFVGHVIRVGERGFETDKKHDPEFEFPCIMLYCEHGIKWRYADEEGAVNE